MEVQAAEDPNDEPELEVLDDNAVKLDITNVPILLSVSQVHCLAIAHATGHISYVNVNVKWLLGVNVQYCRLCLFSAGGSSTGSGLDSRRGVLH